MRKESITGRLDAFLGVGSSREEDDDVYDAVEQEDGSYQTYEAEVVSDAPDVVAMETKAAHDMDDRIDSIVNTIRKAETLLDNVIDVIAERDEARDYEVASQLVNTIVSANKTVMDIHKDAIRLKKTGNQKQINIGTLNTSTTQTANVTVASTKDIMKQLQDLRKELGN
jgi:hypothetical protein